MTQAVTLLAHARELLDEQRGRGAALPAGAPGAPGALGAPKQTMQTEIRSPTLPNNLAISIPCIPFFFAFLSCRLRQFQFFLQLSLISVSQFLNSLFETLLAHQYCQLKSCLKENHKQSLDSLSPPLLIVHATKIFKLS